MLYKINLIKSEMTLVKVTSTKVIWTAKTMAYHGLIVVISRVREVKRWWQKSLWKKNKNDKHVQYKYYLQSEKWKESITLFVRQMSCEKKEKKKEVVFITTNRPSPDKQSPILIWILVNLTNVKLSLLPLNL